MAKPTEKSLSGTSFHGTEISATPQQLINLFPNSYTGDNDGSDKTNFDFELETESGDVFTLYDWKEYKPLRLDKLYSWHVGGFNRRVTEQAAKEVEKLLQAMLEK